MQTRNKRKLVTLRDRSSNEYPPILCFEFRLCFLLDQILFGRVSYKIVVAVPTKSKLAFSPPALPGCSFVSLASGRLAGNCAPGGRSRVGASELLGSIVRCFIVDLFSSKFERFQDLMNSTAVHDTDLRRKWAKAKYAVINYDDSGMRFPSKRRDILQLYCWREYDFHKTKKIDQSTFPLLKHFQFMLLQNTLTEI